MPTSSTTRRGNGSGKGQGWGGPAKGAGSKARSFTDSLENRISGDVSADPKVQFRAWLKTMDRAEQAEALNELVLDMAVHEELARDRLAAVFGFQRRVLGDPPQRVLNIHADATPHTGVDRPPPETREEWLARRRRELAGRSMLESPAGTAD